VAKLDALLSRVAAGEAAARRALERLKRYRSAVLHAAVTGELTRDWRKTHKPDETGPQLLKRLLQERRARWEATELKRLQTVGKPPKDDNWKKRYSEPTELEVSNLSSLPRGWAWTSLQQLGFIVGGLTKNPRRATLRLKMPYLRVGNVYANELRLDVIKTIGVEKDELDKLLLEKGDLLIVEGNGSKDQIGRLAIWDGSIEKCVHQNHIIKVRLVEKALGTWILSWLLSPPGRQHVEKVASSTTGLYTLSVGKVGHLPIPLPPSTEQREIGYEVDRRLAAADRLATTLNRQLDRAHATRQSLLREAFSGKLVPQDPKDEPASMLLVRIRAAREAEANKPKAKRMSKLKSKVVRRPLLEVLQSHKKPISPEQLFRESGFQQEFEANECRQDIVDSFYEELRAITGPHGPVQEKRPSRNTVLLEVKS
jgi:type I restriction enzyme S subunit